MAAPGTSRIELHMEFRIEGGRLVYEGKDVEGREKKWIELGFLTLWAASA